MEGQVMATDDPDQMGRVKIWVPALDGENFNIDQLPWADYASPLMGFTVDYPAGGIPVANQAHSAYGFWAIPKIGATVLVFCLNADPLSRFYFASTVRLHRNRSLPAGRNKDFNGKTGPFGDAGDGNGNLNPIQPAYDNLRTQFQGQVDDSIAQTRGVYERQVAQAKDDKDGKEGYASNPADPSYLDPQTYCLVTPGRHAMIMQDDPRWSRLRLKTAEGHQIIFDDTNERIYMSTAKGKTWVELDQDGHIHVFAAESISFRAGKDINFFADRDINFEADRSFHVKANNGDIRLATEKTYHLIAKENIIISACGIFDMTSEKSLKITASDNIDIRAMKDLAAGANRNIDIRAGKHITETAPRIDLNGPVARMADIASCPTLAQAPSIVPGHEPWQGRPPTTHGRGPNWKP
jgi:hypothetical protein